MQITFSNGQRSIKYLIYLIMMTLSCSLDADIIYKYTDEQGQVYFTDNPSIETGNVEVIKRDPKHIHQRVDKDGSILFENFSRENRTLETQEKELIINQTHGITETVQNDGSFSNLKPSPSHSPNSPENPIRNAIKNTLNVLLNAFMPLIGLILIVT